MNTRATSPSMRVVLPPRIRRKWDRIAFRQLCQAASLQAEEMDRLRSDICFADQQLDKARAELRQTQDAAELWREQALDMQLQLCEERGGHPGMTRAGELVVVQS